MTDRKGRVHGMPIVAESKLNAFRIRGGESTPAHVKRYSVHVQYQSQVCCKRLFGIVSSRLA